MSFAAIAFAIAFASLPASGAAGLSPPDIVLTFTGAAFEDRIVYSLVLENQGDLPAIQVDVRATLPAGLFLADTGGTAWGASFSRIEPDQQVPLGIVALIDPHVAPGTVEVVTVTVEYRASGGPDVYRTAASTQVTIPARAGVPIVAVLGAVAGGVLILLGYAWKVHAEGVRIDQLFLLHDSGMLIRHYSNGRGIQRDSDIMSGMLIILQEFVRDSFNDPRGSLEEVRFGSKRVLMARGRHSIMAAVVTGKRLNGLPARLGRAIAGFEESHMDALSRWNGNLETLGSADAALRSVLAPKYRTATPT